MAAIYDASSRDMWRKVKVAQSGEPNVGRSKKPQSLSGWPNCRGKAAHRRNVLKARVLYHIPVKFYDYECTVLHTCWPNMDTYEN